jgi:hypothetical protein
VVIVQKPLGGRNDRAPVFQFRRARAIGSQQNSGIFVEPRLQRLDLRRGVCDRLRRRKRFRMQFESLDAKKFFADGCGAVPRECGHACDKGEGFHDRVSGHCVVTNGRVDVGLSNGSLDPLFRMAAMIWPEGKALPEESEN